MSRLKVLWLSNRTLLNPDSVGTGSWLSPLAKHLADTGGICLCNVTQGDAAKPIQKTAGQIQEWIIPYMRQRQGRDVRLSEEFVKEIIAVVDDFCPDLIHVWGTENAWGLLTARKMVKQPALLEMQGLLRACACVYAGGLNVREKIACIGLKELLRQSTIFHNQKRFEEWGNFEVEMISHHHYVAVQTAWMEAQVKAINNSCRIFHDIHGVLRDPFYTAEPWQPLLNNTILCSISDPAPYKGLHVAIRALAVLRTRFPDIKLRVAGALQKSGIRRDGYITWLNREAKKLRVDSNIVWLGALTASQLIQEMQTAKGMILPTYVENCSLAVQEALFMGIPLVTSYVGGLPSLARDEETVLFFSPGDAEMCAYQMERLLTDRALAERISSQARKTALVRNDPERIVQNQMEIYRQVVSG